MQLNLGQGEAMNRVGGELVTGNYFAALGVRPRSVARLEPRPTARPARIRWRS